MASDLAYCFPRGEAVEFSVRLYARMVFENVRRTEKTRLKRNAGGNVRKLPMMVPFPSSDNSIGTHFVQNQSASPAFLIRHLPADKRKFCKDLHHRCLRSNATFPPGEGIRSIVQSAFFDTLPKPNPIGCGFLLCYITAPVGAAISRPHLRSKTEHCGRIRSAPTK